MVLCCCYFYYHYHYHYYTTLHYATLVWCTLCVRVSPKGGFALPHNVEFISIQLLQLCCGGTFPSIHSTPFLIVLLVPRPEVIGILPLCLHWPLYSELCEWAVSWLERIRYNNDAGGYIQFPEPTSGAKLGFAIISFNQHTLLKHNQSSL